MIGPKESFVESAYSNRSLIRKHIHNEQLMFETIVIDERNKSQISVVSLKDVANPELVVNVKKTDRASAVHSKSYQLYDRYGLTKIAAANHQR
ncbi:spore germination protein [Paenibacillus sp. GCM10023248]|uniref:spore germination protein n=1 Tax=unclassified Paenibacillus TaxID=185978 RepID=UPI002377E85B|nr:spore germination protein [Paenibacillus sp. MAHUQ-63]MDD9268207.1 spore germination protein [Paenibacillus sp. MAHUQ-63]